LELVKFYAAEITSALEYLNNKGICHRDLKVYNY
jgi:serine/threonine protein kinase